MTSLVRVLAVLICSCFLLSGAAPAANGESPEIGDVIEARDVLPPEFFRSVHYEIDDKVRRSAYFYHFRISSDFGSFEVASIPMLRVRLHEIITIAEVTPALNKSHGALNRAPDGRRGVGGDSIADIFSDPLGTAGTLFGNLAHNFEETFVEPERRGAAEAPGSFGEFGIDPGPHKRSAAAQLDVDVYSSNTALQSVLDRIAAARSAGKLRGPIASAQTFAVGPPVFGSGVLDNRLRSILKNQPAAEINGTIDQRLEALGVPPEERVRFLTNPAYTPRTRLYLTRYLAQLQHANGVAHILASANGASTEADAHAFVNLARMAAFQQLTGHTIERVVSRRGFPVLVTRADILVLALPVDHFSWTKDNAAIVAALQKLVAEEAASSARLLISGRAGPQATVELARAGIALFEQYSF